MTMIRLVSVVVAMVALAIFTLYRCSTELINISSGTIVPERTRTRSGTKTKHNNIGNKLKATDDDDLSVLLLQSFIKDDIFETSDQILHHHNFHDVNLQFYPPPPPPPSGPLPLFANNKNKNKNNDDDDTIFPEGYRLMRLVDPSPKLGEKVIDYEDHGPSPRHQCAGVEYVDYMKRAAQMVNRRVQFLAGAANNNNNDKDNNKRLISGAAALWGRRPTILPPPSADGSSNKPYQILILGNSETRQVVEALEWQYHDQVGNVTDLEITFISKRAGKIFRVDNNPAFYSPLWKENLEQVFLKMPLKDFDVIVMGIPNHYDPFYRDTKYWTYMRQYGETYPTLQIDIEKHPNAFGLKDLMDVYDGPIIFLSPWAPRTAADYKENIQLILDMHASGNRTNLRFINSRVAATAIGAGECAYDDSGLVSICNKTNAGGHRCFGDRGGPPDFAAWDLIEAFYDILG